MKYKIGVIAILITSLFLAGFYFIEWNSAKSNSHILTIVRRGLFSIEVSASGELIAKNSAPISGPSELIKSGIFRVKIDDLIDEGTEVSEGDYVATLDRSPLLEKISLAEAEIETLLSNYENIKLDTALELYQSRDELFNAQLSLQESELEAKQSSYESLEVQRKLEIGKIKAERAYKQTLKSYKLKKKKAINEIRKVRNLTTKSKNALNELRELLDKFIITAKGNGLIVYTKDYSGNRVEAGSTINAFQPTVASLPDLSKMLSKIYVNELDISKIKLGQKVTIGFDAFPNKTLTGEVTYIANIGENRGQSGTKFFEVRVELNETDKLIRPGMTTSNSIIIQEFNNALSVPLECLYSIGDTLSYVYKLQNSRILRQEVIVGESNSMEAIIERGLYENDPLLLSAPGDDNNFDFRYLMDSIKISQ